MSTKTWIGFFGSVFYLDREEFVWTMTYSDHIDGGPRTPNELADILYFNDFVKE